MDRLSMKKTNGDLAGNGLKSRYRLRRRKLKEEKTEPKTKLKKKTMTKMILHPEVNTLPGSR